MTLICLSPSSEIGFCLLDYPQTVLNSIISSSLESNFSSFDYTQIFIFHTFHPFSYDPPPPGLVSQETFHAVFSKFFPIGGDILHHILFFVASLLFIQFLSFLCFIKSGAGCNLEEIFLIISLLLSACLNFIHFVWVLCFFTKSGAGLVFTGCNSIPIKKQWFSKKVLCASLKFSLFIFIKGACFHPF